MSLEREKKAYQITIKVFLYAPYLYAYSFMGRIVGIIRNKVSHKKLVDITYSFEEVRKR